MGTPNIATIHFLFPCVVLATQVKTFDPGIFDPMTDTFEAYRDIIHDFPLFEESLGRPFPVHLRINRLMATSQQVVSTLTEKGVSLTRACREYDTLYIAEDIPTSGNLLEYFLGHIHPQALTSALAPIALTPTKDALILDMCAAPGGKSAHLADLVENTGAIVCNDLYASRHVSLGHTLAKAGSTQCSGDRVPGPGISLAPAI